MDSYSRSITGARSRAGGVQFEGMIEAAALFYEDQGISVIHKNAEPMKILKPYDRQRGQFICCFARKAQPDYKGILCDSTMILFDAKHTDKERISRDCVTEEQEDCFERYMNMGAMCFLVVSLGFDSFYRVPWIVFRDMKKIYGRKYMSRTDLEPYAISYSGGVLRFLDGVELKEGSEKQP